MTAITAQQHEEIFNAGFELGHRIGYAEGRVDRLCESVENDVARARAIRQLAEQERVAAAGRLGKITEMEAING